MALLVLKPKHSLVNVPPFRLINKLREADTPPMAWAHLKKGHAVDSYSEEQLQTELEGLVGAPAADILAAASKPSTKVNLQIALHLAIGEANAYGQPPTKTPQKQNGAGPSRALPAEEPGSLPTRAAASGGDRQAPPDNHTQQVRACKVNHIFIVDK